MFWARFEKAVSESSFTPWVTSLLDNHYHTIGYLKRGDDLGPLMNSLHGGVSKLVNDILESQYKAGGLKPPCLDARGRLVPFFADTKHKNYFDGCRRDEKQGLATFRYVLTQCKRHGVCEDWREYQHTRVNIEVEPAIRRALELGAFLEGVSYQRYTQGRGA